MKVATLKPNNNLFYTSKSKSIHSKRKNGEYKTKTLKSDKVSFKSKSHFEKLPEIVVLPNISNDFVANITMKISEFSQKWVGKFKEDGFKIILSPTLTDGYASQKVFDPDVLRFEALNPRGTLGVTYFEKSGKRFFVFADKPPASNKFMDGIVNHELAHGIENIKNLSRDKAIIRALLVDIEKLRDGKFNEFSQEEQELAKHYFFNNNAFMPIDEIIADTIAWQQKSGGVYGSGLIGSIDNPDLIPRLFPNLSKHLKTHVLG